MLHKLYDTWYAPKNATLIIAGSVDPGDALSQIKQLFNSMKHKKLPSRPRFQLKPVRASVIQMPTDQPYGLAMLTFRMPGYKYRDLAAAQVLAQVLSSQSSSFYSRLVPTGKALRADFNLDSVRPASVGYAVAAFPDGTNAKVLVSNVRKILSNIAAAACRTRWSAPPNASLRPMRRRRRILFPVWPCSDRRLWWWKVAIPHRMTSARSSMSSPRM